WKAGSWVDRTIMAFAVFAFSLPVFVVGYVLAYVFALQFEWLPVQGYTPLTAGFWPWLQNLILPAVALGTVYIALIARITRASMLEVLQQDYVRTARAKGLDQRNILFVHALKNAAVPIVTVIGIGIAPQLPDLLLPVAIRRGVFGFLRSHPTVAIGGALLLCLVLIGIFAPWLGTVDPTALAPAKRTRLPSADYWFGTDLLGRDIYSRVLYGALVSLTVGLSVAVLA